MVLVAAAAGIGVVVAAVACGRLVPVRELAVWDSLWLVIADMVSTSVLPNLSLPAVFMYPHSKLQPSASLGCDVVTPGHAARHSQ